MVSGLFPKLIRMLSALYWLSWVFSWKKHGYGSHYNGIFRTALKALFWGYTKHAAIELWNLS